MKLPWTDLAAGAVVLGATLLSLWLLVVIGG